MIDLSGRVAVVFGLANKRSIAYGLRRSWPRRGRRWCCVSVGAAAEGSGAVAGGSWDRRRRGARFSAMSARDEEIDGLFAKIANAVPKIDILVHSVAFAPPDAIKNDFLLTKRDAFRIAHDVSVYSLIAVARGAGSADDGRRSDADVDVLWLRVRRFRTIT